jgi:hypothetical protein
MQWKTNYFVTHRIATTTLRQNYVVPMELSTKLFRIKFQLCSFKGSFIVDLNKNLEEIPTSFINSFCSSFLKNIQVWKVEKGSHNVAEFFYLLTTFTITIRRNVKGKWRILSFIPHLFALKVDQDSNFKIFSHLF